LLRSDFAVNSADIFNLEREYSSILEKKLASKVSGMKIFENLNSEKPTPAFLTLAQNKTEGKLSLIRDRNNLEFASESERNKHIFDKYAKIYNPDPSPPLRDDIIYQFLGPEICNSDLVRNSKLKQDEKDWLDRPLSLEELDIAASKGKLRSAPGADGFSNYLIKKCWHLLRIPFFKYVTYCYNTGILTQNFRSATIKLIPKKGDLSVLKNWRPISLLSNFYKILSRAINTRLNRFVNRICSRAQKGYNPRRYTQEVLINVWEQIQHCKVNNIKGAIVAIDMAKAFDTLSHDFLGKVYDFFNFGDNIKNWLSLLGNQREACIILDSGKTTKNFPLRCGRPQGDNISPNTFNFAEQILIFKIELEDGISRVPRAINQQHVLIPVHDFFCKETSRETDKNESLADDNTTITLLERTSLLTVRNILNEFGEISGLKGNFDKSCVMPTLPPTDDDIELITSIGFQVSNEFRLLGLNISNNLDTVEESFNKIKTKVINLIRYWERFKLPGRITIAKTFLISQLNYIGCFLPVPAAVLDDIQQLIDGFIKKNCIIREHQNKAASVLSA
jgi:hypothetical protein